MFESIVTKAVTGAVEAAKVVDQSVVAFKSDRNNMDKAKTVAEGLLSLLGVLEGLNIKL